MAFVSTGVLSNPKRVMHMLWIASAVIFSIAVFRSLSYGTSREWVSDKVQGMMGNNGRASLKEHITAAETSWANTVRQRHDLIRADWGTVDKLELYPAVSVPTYFTHPYTVWDFTPASWACPHEMNRVGRMGDGGKWVCGMSRLEAVSKTRPCVIYSFGVQNESSFENEMLSRTQCKIWAYDFSVVDFGKQLEASNRDRAQFFQAGIAGKTDTTKEPPFYSISDLMKKNGHDYIDVLKMDIEFAEYEAMDGLSEAFPTSAGLELPIGQLMVEIHLFPGRISAEQYLKWWERLEARGLRPTWTEPNLLAVTLNINGDKNPNMAEYTLLNVHDSRSAIFGGAAIPRSDI